MCNILILLFLFVCVIIWFACFVCVCVTMCVLLANEWATLQAAYLGCAKLALCCGASSWATIHHRGGILKDGTTGFVSIQTVFFELWADLYRAWTQLYMFCTGS